MNAISSQSSQGSGALYAGIDVALKTNVLAVLNDQDQLVLKPTTYNNDQAGAESLEDQLNRLCHNHQPQRLLIGTEATSVYDFHVADFLSESCKLLPFGAEVYRFNAIRIKRFRQSLGELEKTDSSDAVVIAQRLRFGQLPSPYSSAKPYHALQRLTRYRLHLTEELAKEKNYFLTQLFLKASALVTNKPVKQLLGATSRSLIMENLTGEEIALMPMDKLLERVKELSKNHYADPGAVAKALQQAGRLSYRVSPKLSSSLDIILGLGLRTIKTYEDLRKEVDSAIAAEMESFPKILTTIPGIGKVYSAGILAEVGDISRFRSQDALAKYSGLWWPRHQSGEFEADDRKLRKTGNAYLRYYLVEAANLMRVYDMVYKDFYDKKYAEVRTHQHKRAVALTARKLVRLVFTLLKQGKIYRPMPQPVSN